ncbi:Xylanolytic transcriptional activator xlnR -like protein [Escovopsis weberi]|uniref:Xylanolytic transcriptional activator xlnR-like protein n=1 Tax=Escovopsis weberi TaxID=150374 RepID=A0A0M8N6G0_ESCWE|nr:Xylanolytic transcriptional activator xlnR -like protein [Escovopsis weberi]
MLSNPLRQFGLVCEYIRERKKRGKASRKEIAAQQAALPNGASLDQQGKQQSKPSSRQQAKHLGKQPSKLPGRQASKTHRDEASPDHGDGKSSLSMIRGGHSDESVNAFGDGGLHQQSQQHQHQHQHQQQGLGTLNSLEDAHGQTQAHLGIGSAMSRPPMETASVMSLDNYGEVPRSYASPGISGTVLYGTGSSNPSLPGYHGMSYAAQVPSPAAYAGEGNYRLSGGEMNDYGMANESSPSWGMSFPSPNAQFPMGLTQHSFKPIGLRYPVLEPLVPHLSGILPVSLACDLIDLYFSSSSSAHMHPMSPYVLGFVFRKRAFLHTTNPRRCQPALLASMLWVAAQTSEASFLTSAPCARGKICQKLLELTIGLVQPLIHTSSNLSSPNASPVVGAAALGGLGVALPGSISLDSLSGETRAFGATGSLDDVITYVHLATVISASEYKGASLRWWGAAWSLARELKLGRELPPSSCSALNSETNNEGAPEDSDEHDLNRNGTGFVSEEEREERRRVWWLIYIVDRHLALCYNRPLFLLDSECYELCHPMEEGLWQSGRFSSRSYDDIEPSMTDELSGDGLRIRGPLFECHGHSIFGYFLPLMTILGEIVDVHHSKSHPRFGVGFRPAGDWDEQVAEIRRHLETYERSLQRFEQRHVKFGKGAEDQHRREQSHDNNNNNNNNSSSSSSSSSSRSSINSNSSNKPDTNRTDNGVGTGGGVVVDEDMSSPRSERTTASNRMTENEIQSSIVIAYSTHVMHVLHILLEDKWDPINLLDDHDLWISSQGFMTATSHAVSAAEAISQILEFDPGLEFMPFFYGMYLLQGSFLLLLIADKLQSEASPSVTRACETIVRAHEACVVTLSTEYQRNFSKIMRSALALIRGRVPEDLCEQQQRRRELLGLYRWTGNGTGLAL